MEDLKTPQDKCYRKGKGLHFTEHISIPAPIYISVENGYHSFFYISFSFEAYTIKDDMDSVIFSSAKDP